MNIAACTVSGSLTARPTYSEKVDERHPEHDRHDHHAGAGQQPVVEPEPDGERGDHEQQHLER